MNEPNEQTRPPFHGKHLVDELFRCQTGQCTCLWLANEIEKYIDYWIGPGNVALIKELHEKLAARDEEIAAFKANNRYHRGYTAGERAGAGQIRRLQSRITELIKEKDEVIATGNKLLRRAYEQHLEREDKLKAENDALRTSAPKLNIKCECKDGSIPVIGTTMLDVIRVEQEDDGSYTAITDYWPTK